jgi:hypothetical protein
MMRRLRVGIALWTLILLILYVPGCNTTPAKPALTMVLAPAQAGSSNNESLKLAQSVLQHRLDQALSGKSVVTVMPDSLKVEIWDGNDAEITKQLALSPGEFSFLDSEARIEAGAPEPANLKTILTEADVQKAEETQDQYGQSALEVTFRDHGKQKLAEWSTANQGHYLVITHDGVVLMAPIVMAPVTAGKAVISGTFTKEEAKLLIYQLNSGRIPFELILKSIN